MCENCEQAATAWHWGGYSSDCRGCLVRTIAKSPSSVRARLYEIEREQNGQAAAVHLKEEATAEYWRIQKLKGGQHA